MSSMHLAVRGLVFGLLLVAACGGGDDSFTLRIIGSDGAGDRLAISGTAIDQVQLILDPALNARFDPRAEESFEGGDVLTRVSAPGEFVITLQSAYLERNLIPRAGGGFDLDVPLRMESEMMGSVPNPSLQILLIQRDAVGMPDTIGTFTRGLVWPLPAGETEVVTIGCIEGREALCAR